MSIKKKNRLQFQYFFKFWDEIFGMRFCEIYPFTLISIYGLHGLYSLARKVTVDTGLCMNIHMD